MKIEPKIFDELKRVLVSFGDKYFVGEELNRSKLSDDLRNYDEALLGKLFQIDFIKQHFIKEVAGQKLFQIEPQTNHESSDLSMKFPLAIWRCHLNTGHD